MAFGLAVGPWLNDGGGGGGGLFVGRDPSCEGRQQTAGGISDPGLHGAICFGLDHLLEVVEEITSGDKLRNRLLRQHSRSQMTVP